MLWRCVVRRLSQRILLQLVQQVHDRKRCAQFVLRVPRATAALQPANALSDEVGEHLSQGLLRYTHVVDGVLRHANWHRDAGERCHQHCAGLFRYHVLQTNRVVQARGQAQAHAPQQLCQQERSEQHTDGQRFVRQHHTRVNMCRLDYSVNLEYFSNKCCIF